MPPTPFALHMLTLFFLFEQGKADPAEKSNKTLAGVRQKLSFLHPSKGSSAPSDAITDAPPPIPKDQAYCQSIANE